MAGEPSLHSAARWIACPGTSGHQNSGGHSECRSQRKQSVLPSGGVWAQSGESPFLLWSTVEIWKTISDYKLNLYLWLYLGEKNPPLAPALQLFPEEILFWTIPPNRSAVSFSHFSSCSEIKYNSVDWWQRRQKFPVKKKSGLAFRNTSTAHEHYTSYKMCHVFWMAMLLKEGPLNLCRVVFKR